MDSDLRARVTLLTLFCGRVRDRDEHSEPRRCPRFSDRIRAQRCPVVTSSALFRSSSSQRYSIRRDHSPRITQGEAVIAGGNDHQRACCRTRWSGLGTYAVCQQRGECQCIRASDPWFRSTHEANCHAVTGSAQDSARVLAALHGDPPRDGTRRVKCASERDEPVVADDFESD